MYRQKQKWISWVLVKKLKKTRQNTDYQLLVVNYFITFASAFKNESSRNDSGEMVEWSITVVLKTTVPRGTGGSNPSLSAKRKSKGFLFFCFSYTLVFVAFLSGVFNYPSKGIMCYYMSVRNKEICLSACLVFVNLCFSTLFQLLMPSSSLGAEKSCCNFRLKVTATLWRKLLQLFAESCSNFFQLRSNVCGNVSVDEIVEHCFYTGIFTFFI